MKIFLILILLSTVIFNSGCCLNKCRDNSENIISRVPKLDEPINVKTLYVWRDGGSLGFVVNDSTGKNISFMVDGRIKSTTIGYVFLNTTHTSRAKGIMLPLFGKEECQLMNYLSSWLYSNYDEKTLDALFKSPDLKKMSKKDFKAFHITRLLKYRQKWKLTINKKENIYK